MSQRILVADDCDVIRRLVHSYLAERDFDVCGEAVDGEDAIEKARELKPDLILLDLAMPRKNGIRSGIGPEKNDAERADSPIHPV